MKTVTPLRESSGGLPGIRRWVSITFCLGLLAISSAADAAVVFQSGEGLNTLAGDGINGEDTATFSGLSTFVSPLAFSHEAEDGASNTTSDYVLIKEDSGALIRVDFTLSRSGNPTSRSWVYSGPYIRFTVTEPTSYDLSGFLTAQSDVGTLNIYSLDAQLGIVGAGDPFFRSQQESINVTFEQFTLGETGGNFQNRQAGSLSGVLVPGVTYEFAYSALIRQFSAVNPASPANGGGFMQLSLGGVTVPEPGTCYLLAIGLIVCATARRR